MKLKRCYVSSFGKLKDYTYNFSDGLNVIKEENGFGKSTLATFIKCVFYGLNDSKRKVSDNERTKYRPWNSTGTFGGYVEFEWGGQSFKIERFFGSKESEDTVKLYDLNTGKVHDNPEDIGRRIFEIDEEGFLSTTYFSQKDFQIKSNTSLTAKFNSVCEIQQTDMFDEALVKIEEKAKTFKYRGDKGLISETKQEIYKINDQIEQSNKAVLTSTTIKSREKVLQSEIDGLKVKLSELLEKEKSLGKAEADALKRQNYQRLSKEIYELNRQKEQAENILNGRRTSQNEVNAYIKCAKEIETINIREESLKSDVIQLEASTSSQVKNTKTPLILGLGCVLFAVISLIISLTLGVLSAPSIVLWALTLMIGVFLIVFITFNKKAPKTDARFQQIVQSKKQELLEYGKIKWEYQSKIDAFIMQFNLLQTEDRELALDTISKAVAQYESAINSLKILEGELNKMGDDKSFLNDKVNQCESLDYVQAEKLRLQAEYDEKTHELAKTQASIGYYDEMSAILPELEEKKIQFAEKLAQYKAEFELLNLTAEFMKKADENLKVKYREPLQKSLNKYLTYIAGEKVVARIDIDLNVTIEENGEQKVTDYYSKGYQNLFEICKRFALTDVLFKAEKPFIVLDDPFYNLDESKLKSALELVKKLSDEYQIIYFVCHESRV